MEKTFVKALECLNQGQLKPKESITFNTAVNILNEILNKTYQKENYFLSETYEDIEQKSNIKELSVFRLCALTNISENVSVNIGGILYENPFFAVVAALNINNKLVLPIAKNYEIYKTLQQKTELGLKKTNFKPDFFEKALSFFNPENYDEVKPSFDFINISQENLKLLQKYGGASFSFKGQIKFFELYSNPIFPI